MTTTMRETAPESRTYFGDSLEELLPRIREELGPDAIIVRQREGVVGGIGGFFGKKCVEVEAQPATAPHAVPSVPARAIVDMYDTSEEVHPPYDGLDDDEDEGYSLGGQTAHPRLSTNGLEAMLATSAPFGSMRAPQPATSPFEQTLSGLLDDGPEFEPFAEPPPAVPLDPRLTGLSDASELPATREARPRSPQVPSVADLDEPDTLLGELTAAGIPTRLAVEILAEARHSLRPFEPDTPLRELCRRALTRRVPVARMRRAGRRRIAVIGAQGSGRTLAVASLCTALSASGRTVAALSLEGVRPAMRLNGLVGEGVGFAVADAPDLVARACAGLWDHDVVVADLPPLVDGVDPRRLETTLALVEAFRPDEVHLVLPAGVPVAEATAIVTALLPHRLPTRIIVSHCDDQPVSGAPVALSATHELPVSFLSTGPVVGRLRAADPDALAAMVL